MNILRIFLGLSFMTLMIVYMILSNSISLFAIFFAGLGLYLAYLGTEEKEKEKKKKNKKQ